MKNSKFISKLKRIDLFSFLPKPKTNKVSTKRSLIGSIILIILFVSIAVSKLYFFIMNNPPKVNKYKVPLDENNYNVPDFAITFIYGENLD